MVQYLEGTSSKKLLNFLQFYKSDVNNDDWVHESNRVEFEEEFDDFDYEPHKIK